MRVCMAVPFLSTKGARRDGRDQDNRLEQRGMRHIGERDTGLGMESFQPNRCGATPIRELSRLGHTTRARERV
jgi:hypothetical protein